MFDQLALRGGTLAGRALRGQREGEAERFQRDRQLTAEAMQQRQFDEQVKYRAAQEAMWRSQEEAQRALADRRKSPRYRDAVNAKGEVVRIYEDGRQQAMPGVFEKPPVPARDRTQFHIGPDGKAYWANPETRTAEPVANVGQRPALTGNRTGIGGAMQNKAKGNAMAAEAAFQEMVRPDAQGTPQFALERTLGGEMSDVMIPGGPQVDAVVKKVGAKILPSWAGGANLQKDMLAEQVAARFVNAWLVSVSGAAFTDNEYQRYVRNIVPSTGDSPALRAQKLRTWTSLRDAMQAMAGQYDDTVPEAQRKAEALAALQGYTAGAGTSIQDEVGASSQGPPRAAPTVPDSEQLGDDFRQFLRHRSQQPPAFLSPGSPR
jgi:hypothetical protein